jgi:hypothetical protein
MASTTWKHLIEQELTAQDESWSDVVHSTLTEEELNRRFDCSFGAAEGVPFTIWTTNRVYFPAQYDGSEWCESVSRNPCDERTYHIGGG